MPWIVSKYWSAFRRMATADASGNEPSRSATSEGTRVSTPARYAPALQQRHEQDAGRRQIEDVLRPAVGRPPHLHDLGGPQQVPAPLQVPCHDHAVRDGFFDAPTGIAFFGRPDLGDEQGRASLRAQHRAEAQEEVPDSFLVLDPVAHGGDGVDHQAPDLLLLDDARDRLREEPRLVEIQLLRVDPELLVHPRQVNELELALLREPVVEEVEWDHVLQEFVRRLRDTYGQGV